MFCWFLHYNSAVHEGSPKYPTIQLSHKLSCHCEFQRNHESMLFIQLNEWKMRLELWVILIHNTWWILVLILVYETTCSLIHWNLYTCLNTNSNSKRWSAFFSQVFTLRKGVRRLWVIPLISVYFMIHIHLK